jgi:protoporphyrinogen oxidase
MSRETIAILGGGLTGLSMACKEAARGNKVFIVEKERAIGGLVRSFHYDGYAFDIGPHILRSFSTELLTFAKTLTPCAFTYSNPAIWRPPGILHDPVTPIISCRNLRLLPKGKRGRITKELGTIRGLESTNDYQSFEECIKHQIGETLYHEYFKEYTEKWWGIHAKLLSSDMAPKILGVGMKAFYGHITTNFKETKMEVYPIKGGIGSLSNALAERVRKLGGKIITNATVTSLEINGDAVKSVNLKMPEKKESTIQCNHVYSTIPITQLARLLKQRCRLRYRSIRCIFLTLKGISKVHRNKWLYFHSKDILFGRVSEPSLFSSNNARCGTSLCVEVTCFKDDDMWNSRKLPERVVDQLHTLGIIRSESVSEVHDVKIAEAYPIYVKDYKKELRRVSLKIGGISNLGIAGRTGSFKYMNMDECLSHAL